MMLIELEVNRILLESDNASISLRQLYELNKTQTKKCSLSFLCRRTGIPSKGYLAFVMTGERKLNVKYWASMCAAFKLNERQTDVMQLLLERDAELTRPRRGYLEERLKLYRERLN